jgi:hypothetical protein
MRTTVIIFIFIISGYHSGLGASCTGQICHLLDAEEDLSLDKAIADVIVFKERSLW